MTDTTRPNNSRVTLAVLQRDILHLTEQVEAMRGDVCGRLDDHEDRIRVNEKQVTQLSTRSNIGDVGATMAAAVMAALAFFLKE